LEFAVLPAIESQIPISRAKSEAMMRFGNVKSGRERTLTDGARKSGEAGSGLLGDGKLRWRRMILELCAMLGPQCRAKHAACEPTFAEGISRVSTTAVESEVQPGAGSRRCIFRELWFHQSADIERMLVPQSRAKHGTQKLSRPCQRVFVVVLAAPWSELRGRESGRPPFVRPALCGEMRSPRG
jgi:hypothetical protein